MTSAVVRKHISMWSYGSNSCAYYWSEVFHNNVAVLVSSDQSHFNHFSLWHLNLKNFRKVPNGETICDCIFGWIFIFQVTRLMVMLEWQC